MPMQVGLNGKHQRRQNPGRKNKRQKNDGIQTPTESMKLTDVNTDCLVRIFEYLRLDDLLNIAHTNKELKTAADLTFVSSFKKERIYLDMLQKRTKTGRKRIPTRSHILESKDSNPDGEHYRIEDLQTSLRLLRCFGHLIDRISIHLPDYSEHVVPYLTQFCADSLKDIEFVGASKAFYEDFYQKPFLNVETVRYVYPSYLKKFNQFMEFFPKMSYLGLYKYSIKSTCVNNFTFPHLSHLSIKINDAQPFLQNNPQLRSLRVECWGDSAEIRKSIENATAYFDQLENLEFIKFSPETLRFDKQFYLKNLKRLTLNFHSNDPLPEIPFICIQLEELEINAKSFPLSDEIIDSITKHPTITKLCIDSERISEKFVEEKRMKVLKSLPLLKEVNFNTCKMTCDEVVCMIDQCKFLTKISFPRWCSLLQHYWSFQRLMPSWRIKRSCYLSGRGSGSYRFISILTKK